MSRPMIGESKNNFNIFLHKTSSGLLYVFNNFGIFVISGHEYCLVGFSKRVTINHLTKYEIGHKVYNFYKVESEGKLEFDWDLKYDPTKYIWRTPRLSFYDKVNGQALIDFINKLKF